MGKPWTEAEDNVIRAHWPGVDALPAEDVLAMLPGRNRNQLDHRARKLGIQRHPAFVAAQISAANAGTPKDNDGPIRAGEWPPDAPRFQDFRMKPARPWERAWYDPATKRGSGANARP